MKTKKFLLVEDDEVCLVSMKSMVEEYGECDVAHNGMEAIKKIKWAYLKNGPYDGILLDINMPELNGILTLKIIRHMEELVGQKTYTPIIMTTVRDDSYAIMSSFKDQCDSYLVKPISKEKLVQKFNELQLIAD